MRRLRFSLFLVLPFLLLSQPEDVWGRDQCSVSPDPSDDIKLECENGTPIADYLSGSSCGGSDIEISVVGNEGDEKKDANRPQLGKESFIAKVTGVPGREGKPLGDVLSGMAERDQDSGKYKDGFQFPDSAVGLITTCVPGSAKTKKMIFHCDDGQPDGTVGCQGKRVEEEKGYPYFKDPPCRWRLKADKYGNPQKTIDPPPYTPDDFEEEKTIGGQTPPLCEELCGYLNQWQYYDCIQSVDDILCLEWGYRYICNDQKMVDPSCSVGVESGDDWSNAMGCKGEDCRCSGVAREDWCEPTPPPPDKVGTSLPYRSYYRGYSASFERKALKKYVEEDKAEEKDIPVACYGFYDEFDPRYEQTTSGDYRCVIDIDVTERKETQVGKGNFRSTLDDPKLPEAEPFDKKKDMWWEIVAAGFSHLSPKQLDLSVALSDLKLAKIRAVPQANMTPEYLGFAPASAIRDFDDTGPLRTVVRWWHKQETVISTLLTPPTLRLVNAPAWAMGLDSNDPLFREVESSSSASSDGFLGPRERPVDLQIHARDDRIGEILAYLDRTLLTIEEEPLPVIVPAGSPVEFRSRAQALCTWYMAKNPDAENCDEAPDNIARTIKALEDFALRIDQVRRLREQLAEVAGDLLKSQKAFSEPLHAWSKKNLQTYRDYLKDRDAVFALQAQWQQVQLAFREFHEKANTPWCRNDRFTTAIYSLLDPWMTTRPFFGNAYEHTNSNPPADLPERPTDGLVGGDTDDKRVPTDLPSLVDLPVKTLPDRVIDLSVFKGAGAPLKLPVLKVTQVAFDLDRYLPPADGTESVFPEPPKLPPLEGILKIVKDTKKAIPKLCGPEPVKPSDDGEEEEGEEENKEGEDDGDGEDKSGEEEEPPCREGENPPNLEKPELQSPDVLGEAASTISRIGFLVNSMKQVYQDFWDSLNPEGLEDVEKDKDAHKCKEWHVGICMHVEMDLIERFTRIAARPGILLKEDFDSRGAIRGASMVCLPDDHTCRLLNPEFTDGKVGWQVLPASEGSSSSSSSDKYAPRPNGNNTSASSSKTSIEELRTKLREASLPEPIGKLDLKTFPPYIVDPQELLRIFDVPSAIPLRPGSSSSSKGYLPAPSKP